MATHAASHPGPSPTRRILRPIGLILLIVGLVGVGVWGLKAFDASYSPTPHEDSIVSDVAYVIDWIPKPGLEGESVDVADFLVIAKDENDNVVWEGPQDEWNALVVESESAVHADLRSTWLYPSIAAAALGLLLAVFGRRRITTEAGGT